MFSAELKWSGDIMDGRGFLQTGVYYMDEDNEVDFVDYLDLFFLGFAPASLLRVIFRSPIVSSVIPLRVSPCMRKPISK